jgi:hypothetical protein
MATYALTENFRSFFGNLNPPAMTEQIAAAEYAAVKALIENRNGQAAALSPVCFLQGSYRQQTAIHTLHDIDIVALCELWQPGQTGASGGPTWNRHQIFDTIAAPLISSARYRNRVRYNRTSMCIKVDAAMRLEILPVVYRLGNNDSANEPFRLYRPENQRWENGFARYHQNCLTWKNDAARTGGNFIPMIKVLKHVRALHNVPSVSFHIECLLFALSNDAFASGPADYIARVLNTIAARSADDWYGMNITTPCGDRALFTGTEWAYDAWTAFHQFVDNCAALARLATQANDREKAIGLWQRLLGDQFFPHL